MLANEFLKSLFRFVDEGKLQFIALLNSQLAVKIVVINLPPVTTSA
ncbi:unnamed protein product, partial [marine sediment metagenome]